MWFVVGMGYLVYSWLVGPCPGPLMEYRVPMRVEDLEDGRQVLHVGSIQKCSRCHYIVTSGNYHDDRHVNTPMMKDF